MKHLFIGGMADGMTVDVLAGENFVEMHLTGADIHQYRRRTIDTRNGPVDVFTHGVPCPIEHLIAAYMESP